MKKRLKKLVYSAPSDIHGTGLFAKTHIREGAFIGTYRGPKTKKDGTHVLWVFEDETKPVGRDGKNVLRYLDHQDKGNAEFDGFDLYATKDIEPGDEITFDYNGEDL